MTDVPVEDRTRLLSDNGAGYISRTFREYLSLVEDDCLYTDIILPVNTKFEEEDIGAGYSEQFDLIFPEGKCIEPIGESKSDYEIVGEIAKKLGRYEEFSEGKTIEEWIKFGFENSGVASMVRWEEFNKKGYYIVPTAHDWEKAPAGMIEFY